MHGEMPIQKAAVHHETLDDVVGKDIGAVFFKREPCIAQLIVGDAMMFQHFDAL